jgi:hypothetical protein
MRGMKSMLILLLFLAAPSLAVDVKISALPSATTPLAGTEQVPIVQGGTTKKTTAADIAKAGAYRGTTGTISGALTAGVCNTGTATATGATTAMVAIASPVTYPGDGVTWMAYVSATNTVTVKECGLGIITPTASAYNVAVLP